MDMKILQEFMYLSKELSFTKTAKRCYVSQSVLSRHIQALETELGCKLIVRDRRGLELTAYGEAFAERCKKINMEYAGALADLDSIKGGFNDVLKVSYVSPLPEGIVDATYRQMLAIHPEVKLEFMPTWEDRAIVMLRQGTADLSIFITFEEPDPDVYSSAIIFDDHYVLLVPQDNPLSSAQSLRLKDLGEEALLIPASRDFPTQHSRILKVASDACCDNLRAIINNRHDASALAALGRGISMVRSALVSDMDLSELRAIPLDEPDLSMQIRAVWRKDSASVPLESFVATIRDFLAKHKEQESGNL